MAASQTKSKTRRKVRTSARPDRGEDQRRPRVEPNFLYTPQEVADFLRSYPRSLERWRSIGGGPRYLKMGKRVCYRGEDVLAFVEQQVRANTTRVDEPAA